MTKYAGAKIGNVHLKWAFSEAASLFLRWEWIRSQVLRSAGERAREGQGPEHSGGQVGRAVYYMLLRNRPFEVDRSSPLLLTVTS